MACNHAQPLAECFGFDHDSAVFQEFISRARGHPATKRGVAKLASAIARKQVDLRLQARALGVLLSAEAAKVFRSRVEVY